MFKQFTKICQKKICNRQDVISITKSSFKMENLTPERNHIS